MSRHRVYLRLLEKEVDDSPESDRLRRLQGTIEKFGDIEWESLPSLHFRGGYKSIFTVSEPADYEALLSLVDREGYMVVI